MKPYYDHAGITIYHGDCLEVLPTLAPVNAVVTDPPYGVRRPSARRSASMRFDDVAGNNAIHSEWVSLVNVIPGAAVYSFCTWDTMERWRIALDCFSVRSCIVWDKCVHGLADLKTCWAPQHELILFAAFGRHELANGRPSDVLRYPRIPPSKLLHPYQKPVPLIAKLLRHSTGTVLDPYMGSGTTLRAAKDLGRRAIGIEIEEHYCEVAATRLSQEALFASSEPKTATSCEQMAIEVKDE